MLPLLFSACSSPVLDQPAAEVARRPEPHPTTAVALARVDGGRYTLPPSSRPAGAAAPARFPLAGTFERDEARNKVDVWRIPLPVHDNLLPTRTEGTHVFGSDPPPGMVVTGPDGDLPFERNGRTRGSWGFDREHLFVGLASGSAAPVAAAYSVTFPPATEAENGLNFAASGRDARAFVQRDTTFGRDSHRGLLLPAPAEARFDLTVPAAGRLAFEAKLLAPAIRADRASDGAVVRVLVHDARGRR